MILPVGCGEPTAQQSNIPKDFGEKLEKERPDLFIKKSGKKKTEVLEGPPAEIAKKLVEKLRNEMRII